MGRSVQKNSLVWLPLTLVATVYATVPRESAWAENARTDPPGEADAIQVIADVTAIQARCWNLLVRPGIAFAYGETKGVRMIEVLPGGRLRSAFDKAFLDSNKVDVEELCGPIANSYARDLPGVIERR
jgi:hypothetical protein